MEEQLKEEIRHLYYELLQECNGRYLNNDFMHWHEPSGMTYYRNAEELVKKVISLHKLNGKYDASRLLHTFNKEVEFVRDYKYEYEHGKNKIKPSSIKKMQELMDKASSQIKLDFYDVLGDVKL